MVFVSSFMGVAIIWILVPVWEYGGLVGVAIQQNNMADNSLDEKEEDFASAESDQEEKVSYRVTNNNHLKVIGT